MLVYLLTAASEAQCCEIMAAGKDQKVKQMRVYVRTPDSPSQVLYR